METVAFALKILDKKELYNSSSGGAFTALSNYILGNGGIIVAASFNYEKQQTELKLCHNVFERNEARGSKYMQVYPLNSFNECLKWIERNNGPVMFVGTGCQAEAFRLFSEIKHVRDRVYIVDLICHGVSSPILWKDYSLLMGDFEYITFRDKSISWKQPRAFVKKGKKEKSIREYLNIFYNNCCLRPSCYECQFAKTERYVDLTIGDFWGVDKALPDFDDEGGVSLVLAHSEKGIAWIENIKDMVILEKVDLADCIQHNLVLPTEKPKDRNQFWQDYNLKDFKYIAEKYGGWVPAWKKLLRSLKRKILK